MDNNNLTSIYNRLACKRHTNLTQKMFTPVLGVEEAESNGEEMGDKVLRLQILLTETFISSLYIREIFY